MVKKQFLILMMSKDFLMEIMIINSLFFKTQIVYNLAKRIYLNNFNRN